MHNSAEISVSSPAMHRFQAGPPALTLISAVSIGDLISNLGRRSLVCTQLYVSLVGLSSINSGQKCCAYVLKCRDWQIYNNDNLSLHAPHHHVVHNVDILSPLSKRN